MKNKGFKIIRSYTKAIFSIANQLNVPTEYLGLLEWLSKIIKSPQICSLINSNQFTKEVIANLLIDLMNHPTIMYNIFKSEIPLKPMEFYNSFVKLLVINNQLAIVEAIFLQYRALYLNLNNLLQISITSAILLEPAQQEHFNKILHKYFNKDLLISYNLDRNIVAGLIIRFSDQVIDYSLQTQLQQLRSYLQND